MHFLLMALIALFLTHGVVIEANADDQPKSIDGKDNKDFSLGSQAQIADDPVFLSFDLQALPFDYKPMNAIQLLAIIRKIEHQEVSSKIDHFTTASEKANFNAELKKRLIDKGSVAIEIEPGIGPAVEQPPSAVCAGFYEDSPPSSMVFYLFSEKFTKAAEVSKTNESLDGKSKINLFANVSEDTKFITTIEVSFLIKEGKVNYDVDIPMAGAVARMMAPRFGCVAIIKLDEPYYKDYSEVFTDIKSRKIILTSGQFIVGDLLGFLVYDKTTKKVLARSVKYTSKN